MLYTNSGNGNGLRGMLTERFVYLSLRSSFLRSKKSSRLCLYWFILFSLQATAVVPPQLWQPNSGILMTNDISETNLEEAVPCFALSKNDSYVMSASGGKISLFNMATFKVITLN